MTTAAPPVEAQRPQVSAARLIATLGGAGALAGLALVFVYQATQPRIQAHKAKMLRLAIHEVLHDPARYETLYLVDGKLTPDGSGPDRVYLGYDEAGKPVGFAIAAGEPGFQDVVRLIFGYDPVAKRLLGMRVLESKETPGLGDKIEKDTGFVDQFEGRAAPLEGVKSGEGGGADAEVDMITGATISSRAVIRIINNAIEKWQPHLEAYGR
jgi:electron transport complex protein RnfG